MSEQATTAAAPPPPTPTPPRTPPLDHASPTTLATPSPPRAWDDAPQRAKTSLLILLAALGGALLGMLEADLGHHQLPLWGGLLALVGALLLLADHWLWQPVHRLILQLEKLNLHDRAAPLPQLLPIHRHDELGRIARAFHRLVAQYLRGFHESRQLRRTLDDRVAKATAHATHRLQQLAMRDPLTGLANRRFLDENLEPLALSSLNSSTPLSCIAIDMDNFKLVNDTLGHKAGDELLAFLASLIRANARNQDFTVRLGGDEFLLILPGCRIQRATQLAHTIALLFRQNSRTVHTSDIPVDLSFGVACLGPGITCGKQLLERADANLYAAKRSGKGRIVTG